MFSFIKSFNYKVLMVAGAIIVLANMVQAGEFDGVTIKFAKAPHGQDEIALIEKWLAPFKAATGMEIKHTVIPWGELEALLEQGDSFGYCKVLIHNHLERALNHLHEFPQSEVRGVLESMTRQVMTRNE